MSPTVLVLAGAVVGLGVFLIIRQLLPPAPPRLDAAIDHFTAVPTPGHRRLVQAGRDEGVVPVVGGWLTGHLARPGRLAVPHGDLALLGKPVERFMVEKLACFFIGLLAGFAVTGATAVAGLPLPWAVPAGATLAAGAALSFAPDLAVRLDARRRREEFRAVFASYLRLVILERSRGAGVNEALEGPTRIARNWVCARIAFALDRARLAQTPPWQHLAELGGEVGVDDLADLADIAERAGNDGAMILETLTAKAESLRAKTLADARARANAQTITMGIPLGLLGLGFIVLLVYPYLYRLVEVGS